MKKFLLPLFLAFAVLVPTLAVEAADVPSFSRVAGNYVPFKLKENNRKKGQRTYYYECSVNLQENFAEQYINLLTRSGLSYVGHKANDWRRTSSQYLEEWYFNCRGQRVRFWKYSYFNEGRKVFSVTLPYSLTYEGD